MTYALWNHETVYFRRKMSLIDDIVCLVRFLFGQTLICISVKCKFSTTTFSIIVCWPEYCKCLDRELMDEECVCVCVFCFCFFVVIFIWWFVSVCVVCLWASSPAISCLSETFWQTIFQTYHSSWIVGAGPLAEARVCITVRSAVYEGCNKPNICLGGQEALWSQGQKSYCYHSFARDSSLHRGGCVKCTWSKRCSICMTVWMLYYTTVLVFTQTCSAQPS